MPTLLFAQAPDLGECDAFSMFTPAGTLANTGAITEITGDIGTNAGSITGYSAVNVRGKIHFPNLTTARATIDVRAAYNYMLGLPCSGGAGLAPAMGTGQILTPGTYCFGGAASIAGDLILDGNNQPNALFIFKVNGAFTSAASSRVVLVNGATANNVFWQVGGAASFATNTAFAGTIIAYGAIDLGDGASLQGRALSTVGAISTYNNQIATIKKTPLPVELVAFTALAQSETAVAMTWGTATEKNSDRFEVERSSNGTLFGRIGTVPAAGNSSTPRTYSLTDAARPANAMNLYYRLRQVDISGAFAYSPVRTVCRTLAPETRLLAYPNPAHDAVRVQLLGPVPTEPLQLLDAGGRAVQLAPALGADGMLPLTGLAAGVYMLRCGRLAQRLKLE